MKRICIILALVLVLTCFFGCTQSLGGDESSSQPLSSETSTQTLPMEKRIFTAGAKVGIYSESGEVLVPAQYDEITALDYFFACRKALGSRMGSVRTV